MAYYHKERFTKHKKNVTVSLPIIIACSLFLDVLFIIAADLLSFIIQFNARIPATNFSAYLNMAGYIVLFRILSFYVFHLYDKPVYKSSFEILVNTLKASTASTIIIVFIIYFLDIRAYPRFTLSISWFFTIVLISCWRFFAKEFIELYLGKNFFFSNFIVIGTSRHAQEIAMTTSRDKTINYNFLGFIDLQNSERRRKADAEILGTFNDLPAIVENTSIDEAIFAGPPLSKEKMAELLNIFGKKKIVVKSAPSAYENVISNMVLCEYEIPFVQSPSFSKPAAWYSGLKRLLDIIMSLLLLVLTSPLMLTAIALIKLTSPGPAFYFQKRTGLDGVPFIMYKIRTMRADAENKKKPLWATVNDERVTTIGKILRRYRIDELPQLVNILTNKMSLIGPRPERPYFTNKLLKKIPFYAQRLQVKPGISGWAQVNFKYTDSEDDAKIKLLYDLFYIQNMSFTLDIFIVLKTFNVVLTGQGAR